MGEGVERGDLEIDHDLDFERRSWIVERGARWLMAVVLLAALAGFMGPGPLSRTTIGEGDGPFTLEYSRVGRAGAPSTLRAHVGPVGQRGQVRLWLSSAYVRDVRIERVTPPPLLAEATSERLTYSFAVGETQRRTAISFSVNLERMGWHHGCIGLDHGPSLCFRQFIFP
jgi:hypothetical protein